MKNYYFVVKSEFIHDLELQGCDLLVFSVIYGMSQEKDMFCTMNMSTLSNFVGYSVKQVKRSLARLKAIKYIEGIGNNLYVNDDLRQILNVGGFRFDCWSYLVINHVSFANYYDVIADWDWRQNVYNADKMSKVKGQNVQESKEKNEKK